MVFMAIIFPFSFIATVMVPLDSESPYITECIGREIEPPTIEAFCERSVLRKWFFCHWTFPIFLIILSPLVEAYMYVKTFLKVHEQTASVKGMITLIAFNQRKR